MIRPLYKTAVHEPKRKCPGGHAGLWFDKFCNQWCKDGANWNMKGDSRSNPKFNWINEVAGSQIGNQGEIREYELRTTRLVQRRCGRVAVFTTESRFVTGMGRSHPVENGFAWHPTLGTPYLPGSAVKGLIRAWAEAGTETESCANPCERLFGSAGNVGNICFMDAVPIAPVRLDADVMTPHYAGWSVDKPPGDWMSPTPIPFLTVAAGTPFVFALIPIHGASSEELNKVEGWLGAALAWAGGGAKTAIGYGRFCRDNEKTRSLMDQAKEERQQQDAVKNPVERWRLEIEGKTEVEVLEQVRIHLQKERLIDPAERRAFAVAVLSLRMDWVKRWRDGMKQDKRTSVGSKKLKERARLLDSAAAETETMENCCIT